MLDMDELTTSTHSTMSEGAGRKVRRSEHEQITSPSKQKHPVPVRIKRRKLKPEDFPKRPLSAYNFFFSEQREKFLDMKESGEDDANAHVSMVKHISDLWKKVSSQERARVDKMAKDDLIRYKNEVNVYEEKKAKLRQEAREEKARRAKKARLQEEKESTKAMRGQPIVNVDKGTKHEDLKLIATSQDRFNQASRANDDPIGAKPSAPPTREWVQDRLEKLLAGEMKALDAARDMKFEQLKLIRQFHNSFPDLQLLASQDAKRISMGLQALGLTQTSGEHAQQSSVSTTRSTTGGVGGQSAPAGSFGLMFPLQIAPGGTIGQGYVGPLVSRDHGMTPSVSRRSHGMLQWNAEPKPLPNSEDHNNQDSFQRQFSSNMPMHDQNIHQRRLQLPAVEQTTAELMMPTNSRTTVPVSRVFEGGMLPTRFDAPVFPSNTMNQQPVGDMGNSPSGDPNKIEMTNPYNILENWQID